MNVTRVMLQACYTVLHRGQWGQSGLTFEGSHVGQNVTRKSGTQFLYREIKERKYIYLLF